MLQLINLALVYGTLLSLLTWEHGLRGWKRWAALIALVVLAIIAFRSTVLTMLAHLRDPPEWDFMAFWTWGRMAVSGRDFYDPSIASAFGMGRSEDFWKEILDVGFWYPPQTMLMLAPLGHLQERAALLLWYAFHLSCALAAAWVLWRQLAPKTGALGLLAVIVLVIRFPGMQSTFAFAQTNALALLLSALLWQDRQRARAGVWAALGLIVKPYLGIWFIGLLAIKNWKAIRVGLFGVLVICAFTGVLFGFDKFTTYLLNNPMDRAPLLIYSEGVNQSLFATLLRATHQEAAANAVWLRALGGLLSLVLAVPSFVLALKVGKQPRLQMLALAILLLATLVVYPFTLMHYSALTLPVLLLLWSMRARLPGGDLGTIAGLVVLIPGFAFRGGSLTFWLHLALLVCLSIIAVRELALSSRRTYGQAWPERQLGQPALGAHRAAEVRRSA